MNDRSQTPPAMPSRRTLLRGLGTGGAVLLGGVIGMRRGASAQTQKQVAKTVVAYQDKPHGDQRCDNCVNFVPPSSCKLVAGTILPSGWCQLWAKKPA